MDFSRQVSFSYPQEAPLASRGPSIAHGARKVFHTEASKQVCGMKFLKGFQSMSCRARKTRTHKLFREVRQVETHKYRTCPATRDTESSSGCTDPRTRPPEPSCAQSFERVLVEILHCVFSGIHRSWRLRRAKHGLSAFGQLLQPRPDLLL